MIIKRFFVTNANESPGKLYKVQGGTESIFYKRSKGRIYSVAFSKTGRLHFVNANEKAIYRVFKILWFTFKIRIFNHTTYVRDIAFDSYGNLYFSEASGAGSNGKIFRIESGSPTLFQEVEIADVGGFWAGDFTFDTQGNLFISNGNRIPASIYRFRNGTWEKLFTDDSEPIKGLTFLTCDLLCYANWRSEIYILDTNSGLRELVYSNPIHLWISDIALLNPQVEEDTMYEGTKVYTCNSTCWRDDGTVVDTWDFTDINANNANIAALLADIGAPTTSTTDDDEIWNRTRTLWAWLQTHGLEPGTPNFNEVLEYRAALGHWPTIAEFAYMFVTWGGFIWAGGCTCMCRAQTLAALLYRVGISSNRMAIAETKWKPTYSQHMYVVLNLGCHWYYVDPSTNIPELSDTPENVGGGSADYIHPNKLYLIPGSTLVKPMLVR